MLANTAHELIEMSSHLACRLQVAAAVSYMHAHDVIHLDLTSQNLLVADGGNAKVRPSMIMRTDCKVANLSPWSLSPTLPS